MERDVQTRILLCSSEPTALEDVRQSLIAAGYVVNQHAIRSPETDDFPHAELIIIDGGVDHSTAISLVRPLRRTIDGDRVSKIVLLNDGSPSARLASLEAGATGYLLRPFAMAELLTQVRSRLHISELQQ